MFNNLSPSEQLAFTTVRIQCSTNTGNSSIGTGFFFSFKMNDDQQIPVIITNSHVIQDSVRGIFQLTNANADGTPQIGNFNNIIINNFEKNWIPHPKPEIDLSIMLIGPLLMKLKNKVLHFSIDNWMNPEFLINSC